MGAEFVILGTLIVKTHVVSLNVKPVLENEFRTPTAIKCQRSNFVLCALCEKKPVHTDSNLISLYLYTYVQSIKLPIYSYLTTNNIL